MEFFVKYLILTILVSGCATGHVPSHRTGSGFGYSIKEVPSEAKIPYYSHIASYLGNPRTLKSRAKIYTKFAALEYCQKLGKKLILLTDSVDLSKTFRSPELGVTSNGGFYNYDTYKTYPAYMVGFRCDNEFKNFPQVVSYREIKPELIKDFVSDFKGGVQIEEIKSNGAFVQDDVLLKVNGTRVLDLIQIYDALSKADGISASVELIRDRKIFKRDVILADNISRYESLAESIIADYCFIENPLQFEKDSCIENLDKKNF